MSRRGWTWHRETRLESEHLRTKDARTHAELAARLTTLTAPGGTRPGLPGRGRIRQLPIAIESTLWVVLFVERKDGRGFGGLVLHRCRGKAKDPPDEAYELAQHRLSEMDDW